MKRFVYKIIFLKGTHRGHYYIGQHSSEYVEDGYVGSGKFPKRYFKKYGKILGETYLKENLDYADTQEELDKLERKYVDLQDPLCRNIVPGGITNRCTNKGKKLTSSWKQHIQSSVRERWKDPEYRAKQVGKKRTEETRKKISEALKGRTLSKDQIEKIKERNRGTVWINKGNVELRVSLDKLKQYCESGWNRGRSPEIRKQIGEYNRKKVSDPQYIENLKKGTQKAWISETRRVHLSQSMKSRVGMIDLEGKYRTVRPQEVEKKVELGWTVKKKL